MKGENESRSADGSEVGSDSRDPTLSARSKIRLAGRYKIPQN